MMLSSTRWHQRARETGDEDAEEGMAIILHAETRNGNARPGRVVDMSLRATTMDAEEDATVSVDGMVLRVVETRTHATIEQNDATIPRTRRPNTSRT